NVQDILLSVQSTPLKDAVRALDLLKRPEVTYETIEKMIGTNEGLSDDVKEQVEIQIKYEGYIKKAIDQVNRMLKMENKKIPEHIDYDDVHSLRNEAREKLKEIQP